MDRHQQEVLADEIFESQPNMLGSVLALSKMGVTAERMGFPVRMLLVCFQAMKESDVVWPMISEQEIRRQMERWISSVQMGDSLNSSLRLYATQVYVDAHPERDLLAYVTSGMAQWLSDVHQEESDRYVMMAVQNLVNCIAYVDIVPRN